MKAHGWFLLAVIASPIVAQADEVTYQGRSIVAWIRDLKSEDIETKAKALTVLRRVGPEAAAALPEVVALLDDRSTGVRAAAADSLGRMGPAAKAAIPPLILALRAEEPEVVVHAARALGRIGPEANRATTALIAAALKREKPLESDKERIIEEILFAIAKIEAEPTPILIEHCLKNEDIVVRNLGLRFLGLLGEEAVAAVPTLQGLVREEFALQDQDPAAQVLGLLGPAAKVAMPSLAKVGNLGALLRVDPEAELTLRTVREQLQSKEEHVRVAAALVLARFDPTSRLALPIVAERVRAQGIPDSAQYDLGEMAPILAEMDRDGRVAIPALLSALQSKDGNGRAATIVALGSFGSRGKEIVPTLLPLLKDREPFIRRDAAWALGAIGPEAKAAIPALILATKDEDSDVRKMVCKSLTQIDQDGVKAVPPLREAMKDNDPWVGIEATFVIGTLGEKARPAVPELRAMMKEHQSAYAAYSLCRIGEDVTTALGVLTQHLDRDPLTEEEPVALVALARLGPEAHEATPALVKELDRKGPPEELLLDELAVVALGRIGPRAKAAVPILKTRMQRVDGPLRDWCAIALSRIDPDAENAYPTPYALASPEGRRRRRVAQLEAAQFSLLPPLGGVHEVPEGGHEGVLLLLGNLGPQSNQYPTFPIWIGCRVDDPLVFAVSCWAAARTSPGTRAAVPLLIEALKHEDAFVRTTAAYSLGTLGASAKPALPALRTAQADQERSVRDWSTRALQRISP